MTYVSDASISRFSNEAFLRAVAAGQRCKPPKSWLEQQDREGRAKAKYMIWHNSYDGPRRMSVWLMATSEDYGAAGYREPV